MPGCLFESHLWSWSCLARLGSHLVVNRAAKIQDHPFLGPFWAHFVPMSKHLGPHVASRWLLRVDVARSFVKTLIFLSIFCVEVGFVC